MVAAAGLAISAYSAYSSQKAASKAAKQASSEAEAAAQAARESLDFQKEQYSDWKAVYGDLQTNLGDYYKSLTPERTTAMGLQNVQKEYQAAVKEIGIIAAQRGIANSGLETSALISARLDNAKQRATVRTMAPIQVAQEKAGFLSIGLQQGTQMLQTIGNAYNTSINSKTQLSGNYLDSSNKYGLQAADTMSSMGGMMAGWAKVGK